MQKQSDGRWFPRDRKGDIIRVWKRFKAESKQGRTVALFPGMIGEYVKMVKTDIRMPSAVMLDQLGMGAYDDDAYEEPKYLVDFPDVGEVWIVHSQFMEGLARRVLEGKELEYYNISQLREIVEDELRRKGERVFYMSDDQVRALAEKADPRLLRRQMFAATRARMARVAARYAAQQDS